MMDDTDAMAERAAIVHWLRRAESFPSSVRVIEAIADAIERGDHLEKADG